MNTHCIMVAILHGTGLKDNLSLISVKFPLATINYWSGQATDLEIIQKKLPCSGYSLFHLSPKRFGLLL